MEKEDYYYFNFLWLTAFIDRGAHNPFSELLRWVPGDSVWYSTRSGVLIPSDVVKRTPFHKRDTILNTQLPKHSSFFFCCNTFLYIKLQQIDHGAIECAHTAHTFQCARHSFGAMAPLGDTFRCSFVLTWRLVTQKRGSDNWRNASLIMGAHANLRTSYAHPCL